MTSAKFYIRNLPVQYRTILAPMAGFGDWVFRKLLDEIGNCGLMVTEMVSVDGICRRNERTGRMLESPDFSTPQFVQLFGSDPEIFGEAARIIDGETEFDGIDINFGCPARKVIKKGAGSILLKDPRKMGEIVRETIRNTSLPVTAKIRLGFYRVNVEETVKVLHQEGVDAIGIHFRLKTDNYGSPPKWEYAESVREIYPGILFGNGDIFTVSDAEQRMAGMDGIMIGRGAVRNPMIFREIETADGGGPGETPVVPPFIFRLLELIEELYEDPLRLSRLKAFTRYVFSTSPQKKIIRHTIYGSKTFEDAKSYLESLDG
jgi:tRNA-dihydrouridine synthase B